MNKNKNQDTSSFKEEKKNSDIKKVMIRLFSSCQGNEFEEMKQILENYKGKLPLNTTLDEYNNTLLTKACKIGSLPIVLLLLDNGMTKGIEEFYGSSYVFKNTDSKGKGIMEIYYELSFRNLVGTRRLRKIDNTHYEIIKK